MEAKWGLYPFNFPSRLAIIIQEKVENFRKPNRQIKIQNAARASELSTQTIREHFAPGYQQFSFYSISGCYCCRLYKSPAFFQGNYHFFYSTIISFVWILLEKCAHIRGMYMVLPSACSVHVHNVCTYRFLAIRFGFVFFSIFFTPYESWVLFGVSKWKFHTSL